MDVAGGAAAATAAQRQDLVDPGVALEEADKWNKLWDELLMKR